jgi:hypothetical protein
MIETITVIETLIWIHISAIYAQNYWVIGLCPSSGILGTREHNVSETGHLLLGPLERADHNVRTAHVSITISCINTCRKEIT